MSGSRTELPIEPVPASREPDPLQRGKRLFGYASAGIAAVIAYYALTADVDDPFHLYQGLLILFLAVLPSLRWARKGGEQLPAFEVLMLTTANAYALPLLNGHVQLQSYDAAVITASANLVLLYQVIAIATHQMVSGRTINTPAFRNEILTQSMHKHVSYGLAISTVHLLVSIYFDEWIPFELRSPLRAVFYGVGMATTFAMSRRWGQGALTPGERAYFVANVAAQALIQFSTLYLVGGISTVLLALIGYVSSSRRLPVVATIALFATVALLHNGKSAMRAKYWNSEGNHRTLELSSLPGFFGEWIADGLSSAGRGAEREMTKKLFDRTSLFHILCLVTHTTPEYQPFLNGQTYAHIPGQLIPRFLYPDKPQAHISTSTLAIYYGLQDEETVGNATIGFGMISEAYANFGFVGVVILALTLGAAYKRIQTAIAASPLLSYPGLFVIILTAWSFQVESTLSIWLSSMSQACIGVLGVPFVLRKLIG